MRQQRQETEELLQQQELARKQKQHDIKEWQRQDAKEAEEQLARKQQEIEERLHKEQRELEKLQRLQRAARRQKEQKTEERLKQLGALQQAKIKAIEKEITRKQEAAEERLRQIRRGAGESLIQGENAQRRKQVNEKQSTAKRLHRNTEEHQNQFKEFERNFQESNIRDAEQTQEHSESEDLEKQKTQNFNAVVSTGAAGMAAVIIGGIQFFRHQASRRRCSTCIQIGAADLGPVDIACSTSTAACRAYYLKGTENCWKECSIKQVVQPMNAHLHQILQNQSNSIFLLIQSSNSTQQLQPAVAFANELKDIEGKTLSKFRIRKPLSVKVEKAIQDKLTQLNGIALLSTW